jgi:hypothetical protein
VVADLAGRQHVPHEQIEIDEDNPPAMPNGLVAEFPPDEQD